MSINFKKIKKAKKKMKITKKAETKCDFGNRVVTYTWCECGENHHGNQQIGAIAEKGNGFNLDDLNMVKILVKEKFDCDCIIYNLKDYLVDEENNPIVIKDKNDKIVTINDAYFLVANDLIGCILRSLGYTKTQLMSEVMSKFWDEHYWDTRRQKVLNKHARRNNVISHFDQEAKYDEGKGTVHNINNMKIMNLLKKEFASWGEKFDFACAEGNDYPDGGKKKNGIGWHGDTERRRVLAMRLGLNPSMPFYYRWKYKHTEIGKIAKFDINEGDVMIMSEWAVGTEWKKSSQVTLVHATGASKYVKPKRG